MSHPKSKETLPAPKSRQKARSSAPNKALYRDAMTAARRLRREHRAYYDANRKVFRATVSKAHGRVFRMKPGPKEDALISQAAREVALGARVEDIFRRKYPHRRPGDEDLYAMAIENFRGKVNTYIRKRPRLKRLRDRRVRSATEPAQSNSVQD